MATAAASTRSLPVILVVNPNPLMASRVATAVKEEDYQIETATSSDDLMQRLRRRPVPELVFMNVGVSVGDGLQTLQEVRELHPELKVIMMGAGDDARTAVQAVRLGALDYLGEPVVESELEAVLQEHLTESPAAAAAQAEETAEPKAETAKPAVSVEVSVSDDQPETIELSDGVSFVCASPAMKEIYSQAQVIAKFDMPVLMLGQSGTGKETRRQQSDKQNEHGYKKARQEEEEFPNLFLKAEDPKHAHSQKNEPEPHQPEHETADHFRGRRQRSFLKQLRGACIFGQAIKLDQTQDAAQNYLNHKRGCPSREREDQHHDEARKVVGEPPGQILYRLTQFTDNHFPHSCLTLSTSTFAEDMVSSARTRRR